MSTYATAQDVTNYIEGWVTDDVFALERLIQRAEKDVDRLIVPYRRAPAPTQVISIPGPVSGTFTMTWNGLHPQTFVEPWNVTSAQLATDLQSAVDIGAGNVYVTGNNPFTVIWGNVWANGYANTVIPLITIDPSNLQSNISATVTEVEGRKVYPPVDLNRSQALALANAVCAQVEYRVTMGPKFFVKSQYNSVKGPDFTVDGKLPQLGPKVFRELSQTGLLFRQGRAMAGYGRRSIQRGWANY